MSVAPTRPKNDKIAATEASKSEFGCPFTSPRPKLPRWAHLPTLSEPRQSPLAAPPADEFAFALQFARAEKSLSTRRAYRSDFDVFRKWCDARKLNALPASPATFATFLASEAKRGVKASTIARRVAGVCYAHQLAGHDSPGRSEIVKATVRGIRRTIGAAINRKDPLTAEYILGMVKIAPDSLTGLRDRTVLLLGFAGAMRRSELVGLNVNDLRETKAGLRLYIRASKTDQERLGQIIAIAPGKIVCPIKALRAWMAEAKITSGPIFRPVFNGGHVSTKRLSDRAVAEIGPRILRRPEPENMYRNCISANRRDRAAKSWND